MKKKLTLEAARWRLLLIWLIGSAILLVPLIYQTFNRTFERTTEEGEVSFAGEIWSWFLPLVVPTIMLMVGSMNFNVSDKANKDSFINKSTYTVCLILSVVYLLLLLFHIYFWPIFNEQDPLKSFTRANFYLPFIQGVAVVLIGKLFTDKKSGET